MSSKDVAVSVRGLSKSYTIAHNAEKHSTMGEAFLNRLKNPLRQVEKETFWALRDVSFDIHEGDVVGIIGRNGAGKSTLLKILSQITEPTSGEISLYGRVGSLLEVGTGFHPELTGRENIYLNGAILGMSRKEIERQFDAIVDFAEVEQFLDTPVKRYSSGMYVRLAFAVAAQLSSEILIVDEVLAVGDIGFQRKCLGKMESVSSQEGRTVLFVSHNMQSITQLCSRAIWLQNGTTAQIDDAVEVVSSYMKGGAVSHFGERLWSQEGAPGNDQFRLLGVRICDSAGEPISIVDLQKPCFVEIEYEVVQPIKHLRVQFVMQDQLGTPILTSTDVDDTPDASMPRMPGVYKSKGEVWSNLLKPGDYHLTVGAVDHGSAFLCNVDSALSIHVTAVDALYATDWHLRQGYVTPRFTWKVESLLK